MVRGAEQEIPGSNPGAPKIKFCKKIADALKVSLDDLMK